MVRNTDVDDLAVWQSLSRAHAAVEAHVQRALEADDLPPLAWHHIMLVLHRAGPKPMRPAELAECLGLAQYALSRLVKRLTEAGLVERRTIPGDRRTVEISLTEGGAQMCHRMWPIYRAAFLSAIRIQLQAHEAETLVDLLARIDHRQPEDA